MIFFFFFFSAEYFKIGFTGWPELGPDLHHVHNCEQVGPIG